MLASSFFEDPIPIFIIFVLLFLSLVLSRHLAYSIFRDMVKEVFGLAEFERELKYSGLVVVDFFTQWCGPCKMIAPVIEQFSRKYPEVNFIKVDIERNEDIAAPRRISSIPTFHFVVNGRVVDEMKGANPMQLEQKINQYKVNVNPFEGSSGHVLSSTTGAVDAREARLRALGGSSMPAAPVPAPVSLPPNYVPVPPPMQAAREPSSKALEAADLAAAERAFAEMELRPLVLQIFHSPVDGEEMVPVPVDGEVLSQMMEMGFEEVRARKAVYHGKTLEDALAWIDAHQDDTDIDLPYLVKKADTLPRVPLTEEQKKQKIEEMRAKIKQKREEQARKEKEEEAQREKQRRDSGQKAEDAKAEREQMLRKMELEKQKKEKLVSRGFSLFISSR